MAVGTTQGLGFWGWGLRILGLEAFESGVRGFMFKALTPSETPKTGSELPLP